MDNNEWDSVLQYISDPSDFASPHSERPVAEMTGVSLNTQHPTPPQVLTPPGSDKTSLTPPSLQEGSPQDHVPGCTIVSVSTTFHPGAALLPIPPDLIFLSADGVFFYVHTTQVLALSTNHFDDLVPPKPNKSKLRDDLGPVVPLPESATVLNIVLHVVYDLSCAHYHPGVDTLTAAVDAMAKYGLPPHRHIAPSTPLYSLILSQAPMQPIIVYALAASHDLYDLAVPVSSHLLSFALHTLTDEVAVRIGPIYMKRLFFLHLGRLDALKRLLLPPPHPHPPTSTCDFTEQKKLTRAWALASAYLAWDARPGVCRSQLGDAVTLLNNDASAHSIDALFSRFVDLDAPPTRRDADLSTSAMENALCPLADHLSCDVCKQSLADRVKQLIIQWSVVKVDMTYLAGLDHFQLRQVPDPSPKSLRFSRVALNPGATLPAPSARHTFSKLSCTRFNQIPYPTPLAK